MKLSPSDIIIHLETNDAIDAQRFAGLLDSVVRLAKSDAYLGADGRVKIEELRTGSITARLRFLTAAGIAADLISLGYFGKDLADLIRDPETGISEQVQAMMEDDSVIFVHVRTTKIDVKIEKKELIDAKAAKEVALAAGRGNSGRPGTLADGDGVAGKIPANGLSQSSNDGRLQAQTHIDIDGVLLYDSFAISQFVPENLQLARTAVGFFQAAPDGKTVFVNDTVAFEVIIVDGSAAPPYMDTLRLFYLVDEAHDEPMASPHVNLLRIVHLEERISAPRPGIRSDDLPNRPEAERLAKIEAMKATIAWPDEVPLRNSDRMVYKLSARRIPQELGGDGIWRAEIPTHDGAAHAVGIVNAEHTLPTNVNACFVWGEPLFNPQGLPVAFNTIEASSD